MERTPENLEHFSAEQQMQKEEKSYTPRPKSHLILAWVLIAVVLLAFFGTCYWLVNF